MLKIARIIGTEDIKNYVSKFDHIKLSKFFEDNLVNFRKKPWQKYVTQQNEHLIDIHAFDLLTGMLKIDHTERLTSKEALEHVFFDEVRDRFEK